MDGSREVAAPPARRSGTFSSHAARRAGGGGCLPLPQSRLSIGVPTSRAESENGGRLAEMRHCGPCPSNVAGAFRLRSIVPDLERCSTGRLRIDAAVCTRLDPVFDQTQLERGARRERPSRQVGFTELTSLQIVHWSSMPGVWSHRRDDKLETVSSCCFAGVNRASFGVLH